MRTVSPRCMLRSSTGASTLSTTVPVTRSGFSARRGCPATATTASTRSDARVVGEIGDLDLAGRLRLHEQRRVAIVQRDADVRLVEAVAAGQRLAETASSISCLRDAARGAADDDLRSERPDRSPACPAPMAASSTRSAWMVPVRPRAGARNTGAEPAGPALVDEVAEQ